MEQQLLTSKQDYYTWKTLPQSSNPHSDVNDELNKSKPPVSYPCVIVWNYDKEYDDLYYTYVYPFGHTEGHQDFHY